MKISVMEIELGFGWPIKQRTAVLMGRRRKVAGQKFGGCKAKGTFSVTLGSAAHLSL